MPIHDYPKIYNVGHKAVNEIFKGIVHIEEKIDGSQFSFRREGDVLYMKTHHQDVSKQEPFGLFKEAMEYVRSIQQNLHDGWTYRGEVISKPKHNLLQYERVPKHNIILFDVDKGLEDFLSYSDKVGEGNRLDLETVPYVFFGEVTNPETIVNLTDRQSCLGSKGMEGVVIKAYGKYGDDSKTVMAKYVTEKFKEEKKIVGQEGNKPHKDTVAAIVEQYRTIARWEKARQRMEEAQQLKGDPSDIGALRVSAMQDLEDERIEAIKDSLYMAFRKEILNGAVIGLPQWYKQKMVENAFPVEEKKNDEIQG